MPLAFPGETTQTISGVSIRAIDPTGKTIVVMASLEAVQDQGLFDVQQVASKKYDSGQLESNGTIVVRSSDFT